MANFTRIITILATMLLITFITISGVSCKRAILGGGYPKDPTGSYFNVGHGWQQFDSTHYQGEEGWNPTGYSWSDPDVGMTEFAAGAIEIARGTKKIRYVYVMSNSEKEFPLKEGLIMTAREMKLQPLHYLPKGPTSQIQGWGELTIEAEGYFKCPYDVEPTMGVESKDNDPANGRIVYEFTIPEPGAPNASPDGVYQLFGAEIGADRDKAIVIHIQT